MSNSAAWSDEAIAACPLSTWGGDPKRCRWCDTPLSGRQRRWCSDCSGGAGYGRQHDWGSVRYAALQRDGHRCVRCGHDPDQHREQVHAMLVALSLALAPVDVPGLTDPATYVALHSIGLRRWWPANMDEAPTFMRAAVGPEGIGQRQRVVLREWGQKALSDRRLEVNHKVPILGRHAEVGCHHHLDGVETLCRVCHQDETNHQFGHGQYRNAHQGALDLAS